MTEQRTMSKQTDPQSVGHAQGYQQTIRRKPLNSSSLSKAAASTVYEQIPQPLLRPVPQPLWTSLWLQKPTLFAISILFAGLSAALIILWRISVSQDGFRLSLSTSHYAWTYGPIAVLVLVMGLWRQVLYYCKVTQAWQEMKKGPTPAERSLLLDYVWPTIPSALWKSVKYRHTPVISAIVGFLILKLIIVVSTSLLVLIPTPISEQITLQLQKTFNAVPGPSLSALPNTDLRIDSNWNYVSYVLDTVSPVYTGTPLSTIYSYLSILAGQSPDNNGTQNNVAFSTIQQEPVDNDTIGVSSIIPAVETTSTCEVANVTLYRYSAYDFCFGLDTSSCRAGHQGIRNSTGQLVNQTAITAPSGFSRVDCGDDINRPGNALPNPFNGTVDIPRVFDPTMPYSYQYAFISVSQTASLYSNPNVTDQELQSIAAQDVSAVLCRIGYSVRPMELTKNLLTATYSINTKGTETTETLPEMSGLSDLLFSEIIMANLYDASKIYSSSRQPTTIGDGVFALIRTTLNQNSTSLLPIGPEELRSTAIEVLNGVGTQMMSQFFMVPNLTNVEGQAVHAERRLHIGTLPLWVMVAGFFLMSLITLIVSFTTIRNTVCHDPGRLATHATILKRSPNMQQQLLGCGALDLNQISERLSRFAFGSNSNKGIEIDTIEGFEYLRESCKEEENRKLKKGRKEWMPLSGRKFMVVVTLVLPLLIIGVLEALYRLSVKNNGVVNVTRDDAPTAYTIRYASTVIALIIANVINCLDSVVSIFAVFSALCSGATTAQRSVYSHLNGHLPPMAFYVAIRDKHYSAALSSAASTIGTLLPIVASGLWMYDDTYVAQSEVSGFQITKWNPQWNSSDTDNGASVTFSDIQHGATQSPPSVWGDLVFPHVGGISFKTTNSSNEFVSASFSYILTVPALRPSLTCNIMSPNQIEVSEQQGLQGLSPDQYTDYEVVWAVADVTPTCSQILQDPSTLINITTSCCGQKTYGGDTYVWGGQLVIPQFLSGGQVNLTRPEGGKLDPSMASPVNGCPSLGAIYANYYRGLNQIEVTAIICYQQIQQVMTEVMYIRNSTGDLVVDKTYEPIPNESTVKNLTNNTTGLDSFDYDIIPYLSNLAPFGTYNTMEVTPDPFFDYLINGPNGTSEDSLTHPGNATNSLKPIEALYRRFMVHVIDLNFRNETTTSSFQDTDTDIQSTDNTIQGIAEGPGRPRLRLQFIPKLVLQVMLGIMTLLSGIAYLLVDLRGTLSRNPCSIASTMALLAGSEMCKPRTTEDDQPDDINSIMRDWEGQKFSLGWWEPNHGESEERFGIDIGTAQRLGFRRRRGGQRDVSNEQHSQIWT